MSNLTLLTGKLPVEKALISTQAPRESLLGLDVDGYAVVMDTEVHRRIVVCVNACRGISTDGLEQGGETSIVKMTDKFLKQRDTALKMVGELVKWSQLTGNYGEDCGCSGCQTLRPLLTRAQALLNEHPETGKDGV